MDEGEMLGAETLFGVPLAALFRLSGGVVLPCWMLLLVAPRWRVTQVLATFVVPLLIAALYVALLVSHKPLPGAGFNSLAQVSVLFRSPYALLAGWIHYLAFDLFTGAWEARDAAQVGISRWVVAPCLLLTFLFGPAGLALYLLLKLTLQRKAGALDGAA
jgi:hypothetical protein